MGLSVDDIVAKFPNKKLPIIQGEPDYAQINNMMQTLYGNAASLPTTLGGGRHGHIGLIMTAALYATLAPLAPFTTPNDPGPTPTYTSGGTGAQREAERLTHTENRRIYDNNSNMDDAMKTLIIDAIEDVYLNELRNKYTGYLGVSTRDLLDHLLDRYGKISPIDIENNKNTMDEPIDTTQPIDVYFKTIDDCVQFAADAHVPYTEGQILQTTYHALAKTGHYQDACKEWRKRQTAQKTWPLFKQFFASEYHDYKEQQKLNSNEYHGANAMEYHRANAAIDIGTALDNLANAATNDRQVVTQLTASNHTLSEANKALTIQLQQALATITTLTTANNNKTSERNTSHQNKQTPAATTFTGRKPFNHKEWLASLDPEGYCWTHGYKVVKGHSSSTCQGKNGGHQDEATRSNTMGGATRGKA
jgi:hypothetical protein